MCMVKQENIVSTIIMISMILGNKCRAQNQRISIKEPHWVDLTLKREWMRTELWNQYMKEGFKGKGETMKLVSKYRIPQKG